MNSSLQNLTTKEKVQSVIDHYNDITKEYCDEFLNKMRSGKIVEIARKSFSNINVQVNGYDRYVL